RIGLPPEEALKVSLQETRQMGLLTPNLENIINQSPTEMLGVNTDPRLRDAQLAALSEFANIGQSGGMRLSDIANYEKSLGDVAARERGAREAIQLDAAQRGASTGGASLASQMLNQQAGSEQRHMDALNLAGRAQDVALQSLARSGELAGDLRGRDYDEQAQKARAQDTINAMNAQAARGTQQRNVASMNDAQASNLGETQRIYDSNINTRNQQALYNAKVPQQMFENQMTKQNAIAGARGGQVSNAQQSGQRQANMWGGIGSGLSDVGSALSGYMYDSNDQPKVKTNGGYSGNMNKRNPYMDRWG
ncbi:hypothetical protein EBZ39_08385, partial [bacterium]|nr:hypothetical protein [bacterium]